MEFELTMKYTRKSFWGGLNKYAEDTVNVFQEDAAPKIEKALSAVLKSTDYTLQITECGQWFTIWMEYADAENKILTVRFNESWNGYSEEKMTKAEAKKTIREWMYRHKA